MTQVVFPISANQQISPLDAAEDIAKETRTPQQNGQADLFSSCFDSSGFMQQQGQMSAFTSKQVEETAKVDNLTKLPAHSN